MKLSIALVSWRRQYHLPELVANLRRFPEIDDILIWQNEELPTQETLALDARVIYSPVNEGVYGRFLAAKQAAHPAVLVHDDDLTVQNIPALIAEFERHGGTKIVANLADDGYSRHWQKWQNPYPPPYVELGFGAIITRDLAAKLDMWPYQPDLRRRKSDKLATIIHPWTAIRAGKDDLTRLFHNGQESGRDENALWLKSDHQALTSQAVQYALLWKAHLASVSEPCKSCISSPSACSDSAP